MAAGTKLVCTFETSNGGTEIFTFNYADPGATKAEATALMNAIIANGAIFAKVPTVAKSVKNVTTSEHEYDLN